jgi:prepilin-type N-terminal cleavage/methylation domain-containing protein
MLTIEHTRAGHEAGLTLIEVLVSMIIMGILTTMLVTVWVNLQRGAVFAMQADNATGAARDSIARIGTELRAAQPKVLPVASPTATATAMPVSDPPITYAKPWDVQFYSPVGSANVRTDGTGVAAVRLTRLYLDYAADVKDATLYIQRDTNASNSITPADPKIVLARHVINRWLFEQNSGDTHYDLFRYGWRTSATSPLQWGDNDTEGAIALSTIVAVRARSIIDANITHTPKFIDTTTTVRLRNASGS